MICPAVRAGQERADDLVEIRDDAVGCSPRHPAGGTAVLQCRVMRGPLLCVVAMLAGCSAVLGIEDLHPPTIHGAVRQIAGDNVSNVSITLYRDPEGGGTDSTPIETATTDGQGKFELPIRVALPLDGYLDLADPRFVRTFSHLTQPVVDHANLDDADVFTLTAAGLATLASGAQVTQDPARSLVIAQIVGMDGGVLVGATVHAEVGPAATPVSQICYTNSLTGFPCATGATGADGRAWLFDVPETMALTITAVDAGGQSHVLSFSVVAGPSLVFTPVQPTP
jgi:hypothetical protein